MKFKEVNALNAVAEFHHTFGLPVLNQPIIPDEQRTELRVNLLQEEVNELKEAIENGDLVEVADALADIQYVLSGAILEFGLAEKFQTLFDEVHRSNMSKTCANEKVAEQTIEHYRQTKKEEGYMEAKEGRFIVHRKGDGKVLKSVEYSPADIKGILTT
ncbi:nucleoside triphosphate pyrophosphohydrolase family protein [Membranihabitans marinus]|uniref:nucleoside triphosphate pyrophosphohydrolase family protein n=1 Tax=Membranihabitans marinus TaxID=1227546 RepID=UPI001F269FCE|nr:nucleoside triphosphate pyrophosphohydrolase family protein [Membranihabitans marinus]